MVPVADYDEPSLGAGQGGVDHLEADAGPFDDLGAREARGLLLGILMAVDHRDDHRVPLPALGVVYGERNNQLSISADDVRIVQPQAGKA